MVSGRIPPSVANRAPAPAAAGRSRRDDILDAALQLIGRTGADGFTAAALAQEAGVSKGNLFHHFDSVDAIALEAFGRLAGGMQTLSPPTTMTFADWLDGLGEETFALVSTRRTLVTAWFVFVSKAMFNPALGEALQVSLAASRAVCTQIIADHHPRRPAKLECERLAALILMSLDGLALHLMVFPEMIETTRSAWREQVAHLAEGAAP